MKKRIEELTFYYDTFAEEVVLTKDEFAAPERYFSLYGGSDACYRDTFVKGDKRLDFAYPSFEEWHRGLRWFLKENQFEDAVLNARKYPMKKFIEVLRHYGYKVTDDGKIEVRENENT